MEIHRPAIDSDRGHFFVILTVLFLLFRLAPGDPVSRMVDPDMTPEDAELLISQLGLDQPLGVQYVYYLKNFITGNFGESFNYGEPVINIIWDRLPNTILLFTTAIILSALAGIFLGKIASWHKGEKTDNVLTVVALARPYCFSPLVGPDTDLGVCIQTGLVSDHGECFQKMYGLTRMWAC